MPEARRLALLDLYDGEPNQGIRCLYDHFDRFEEEHGPLAVDRFEVRNKGEVPDLSYDAYVSSGGPGSPLDGEGSAWHRDYYDWLNALVRHNEQAAVEDRKGALFICHSFQMMCKHFGFGSVMRRSTEAFGVFRVYMTEAGRQDRLLAGLPDPYFSADFRKWQVVDTDAARVESLGGRVLAWERPRNSRPRALMGVRATDEIVGLQTHPEADSDGMLAHFSAPTRRAAIIRQYGLDAYQHLVERLEDPEYLGETYRHVLPNFLTSALGRPVLVS